MLAGDPTEFYRRNGYKIDQIDPARPHIIDMVRSDATAGTAAGDANGIDPRSGLSVRDQPTPAVESGLPFGALSNSERQELERLRDLQKNKERAREYRQRKKAQDAARAAAHVVKVGESG
jgi:hypothetical protein